MYHRLTAVLAFFWLCDPALAADPANGRRLAETWCSGCHVLPGATGAASPGAAPPFAMLARSRTAEQLRSFLTAPHGTMPDLGLSRSDIDDLAADILRSGSGTR